MALSRAYRKDSFNQKVLTADVFEKTTPKLLSTLWKQANDIEITFDFLYCIKNSLVRFKSLLAGKKA